MLAARNPVLVGLRVLVVGLGRSGIAAARMAASRGAEVLAVDNRQDSALSTAVAELSALGIDAATGGHPPELAGQADLLILSPGVPVDIPLAVACRDRGIPVWGEVELAARYCRGKIVGITGSNGKSTTTCMTGSILRTAGLPGGTGGNLDIPLSEMLEDDGDDAVHAVELSSFQLETVDAFRPEVAVIVNLTPDHLDRYSSFEEYALAKSRILEVQDEQCYAVLNADDPESARFRGDARGAEHFFSTVKEIELGGFIRDRVMVLRTAHGEEEILHSSELPVPGTHNVANGLAAALAARLCGCEAEQIAEGLKSFKPLRHRLERLEPMSGVEFYNDSKATNLDAVAQAVRSFEQGKLHLILGGKDKGGDWESLAPLVRKYAKQVLLVGSAAATIRQGLADAAPLLDCGTIENAVGAGFSSAEAGEVVLLSPGCASFDQYDGFEQRGDDFRQVVERLRSSGGDHA